MNQPLFDSSFDSPIWDADTTWDQQMFDRQADYDCLLLQLWNNPYVRNSSLNSIGSENSEIHQGLCQKSICLLGSPPASAEKESIMPSSLDTAHTVISDDAPSLDNTHPSATLSGPISGPDSIPVSAHPPANQPANQPKALAPDKAFAPNKALALDRVRAPELDDASLRADINALLKQQSLQQSQSQEEVRLLHAKIRGLMHHIERIEQQQTATVQTFASQQVELRQLEQRLRHLTADTSSDRPFAAKLSRPADRFTSAISTAIPEPRTQATTYIVPKRAIAVQVNRVLGSVPHFLLLVVAGILLVSVVAIASPNPISLFTGLSAPILTALRITFVVAAFSTVIAAIWEIRQ